MAHFHLKNYVCIGSMFVMLLLPMSAIAAIKVTAASVDHRQNPMGLDNPTPRFSWQLASDLPGTLQSAYELKVINAATGVTLWTSGKVESGRSLYLPYEGPALAPRTRYQWQVRVWDNLGRNSGWSTPAFWETGLMDTAHWDATWITYPWTENPGESEPSPMLRREFTATCPIASARLYATALGLYETYINGQRIGDAYFTPGWTSYDKRLQYQVYEVTNALQTGPNAIGMRLGDGWYRGNLSWETQRNLYGKQLAARAQLRIRCEDGREQIINTDDNWRAATGAIRASDIYNGETQDLRQSQEGWSKSGFNDQKWQSVVAFTGKTPALLDSRAEPVRMKQVVRPVALIKGPNGETIVDMGQNIVGWVRLRATGKAGDEVVLRHAEVLDQQGALYLEALRSAQQRVSYTLANNEPQQLEPHFTFQGFRYVSVAGYPGELTLDDLDGVVLYSDMPQTSHFETSNVMLNQLQSNILWGQRGNFLDVPTDCPQRDERLGWTGDAQVFARTALYNTGSAAFFIKWLEDVRGDQYPSGAVPSVVPDIMPLLKTNNLSTWFIKGMGSSTSGWGDAITEIPMAVYERTGDRQVVADNYAAMQRWVEHQQTKASSWWLSLLDASGWFTPGREYIWNSTYTWGDWLAPEPASSTLVNTAYFARSTQLLAEAAQTLGKAEDARQYAELFQNIRQAFQRRFYQDNGQLSEDVQGAYVLALQFGLLEPVQAEKAAARLQQLVEDSGNHLATGFLSTPYLLTVLEHYGYLDTAYKVLQQEDYPSWLYPITKGATTIWERWGSIQPDGSFGDNGMNSFNHYSYGAVGDWMYQHIGGIRPLAPGYKKVLIAPQPGGTLTHAATRFDSPYGPISSRWEITSGLLHLTVEIPANTSADVMLPPVVTDIRINDAVLDTVYPLKQEDGRTRITIGSGRYMFVGSYQ